MTLTPGQVEAYRNDGYVVVRNALPKRSVSQLREAADSFAEQASRLAQDTDSIELDDAAALAGGPARIRRIKSPHFHHESFAAMLAHPPLLDKVEALIGPDIRWHHTKLNAKHPCGSGHVEWHTDWGYYPHTNDDLLEVGIALDPSTEASGCLRVVPGSHRGPALSHAENGRFVGAVAPGSFDPQAAVSLELEPGDISIHHVRLLHGSGPNRSRSQRRLLLQGYAAVDAWPLMAQHQPSDWPAWDDRILRGRPSVEARLAPCPVKVPLPVAPALGLYEIQRGLSLSHFAEASH